ncbi:MAG: DNA polymerase III subunit delta [Clostridia bacterium]|nr:DNA polymerase III subunit delta [Clostridia bacterium]
MQSIKQQIKDKSVQGAYLIYGEEDYLKDFYTNRIVELCTEEGPVEFNCMKVNTDKIDLDSIAEFTVSTPFMADKKILVIKNSGIFAKANDAVKKFWVETLETLPDYLVIVFCESNVDKRSAIYKAMAKSHTIEEFPLSSEADLINWFARVLKSGNKMMTKDDIAFVIENVGRNMYLLKSEADKLISFTYNKPELISHEDIEACICKSLEGKIFELIDNIIKGDRAKVINGINDLKTLREQPVMIVVLIARQFTLMRRVKAYSQLPFSTIVQKTKQKEFVIKKASGNAKRFTDEELDNAIFMCNKADESIKSGAKEAWLTVEQLAISLMPEKR